MGKNDWEQIMDLGYLNTKTNTSGDFRCTDHTRISSGQLRKSLIVIGSFLMIFWRPRIIFGNHLLSGKATTIIGIYLPWQLD